jgi:hypothetical protein
MDDIKTWLQSQDKNYAQGVELFEKHHKNKMLARYFHNGKPATHAKKLEYELKKLSGIPLTILFAENTAEEKPVVTIALLPDIIKQAKTAVYELFTAISIAHRKLYELGESNSEDVVTQRKALMDERLPLIQRYEQIYLLKEQYFNTGVISPELPLLLTEQATSDTLPPPPVTECKTNLLSGVELMKKKQAVTVAINKIQNRLQYQKLTKGEKPNPMPDSPLREELEAKLATLKEDLAKILQLIEENK